MAVKFYERGAGHATFFTKDGVVIALTKSEGKREETAKPAGPEVIKANKGRKHTTEAVNLTFVGADKKAKITAGEAMPGYVNYFVGSDRSKWRSNIPTYGAVTYRDVYKDIDIKFYGNNKNIEHDVIVRPGGDPSLVKFAYKGVKGLKLTKEGGLEVRLNHGSLIQQRPVIYQEIKGQRVAVDGSYRLLGQKDGAFTYGFDVASYDHDKAIVIDPVITYSTFLGGSGEDIGVAIAVDSTGAAYITGDTQSADFPLMNPIQGVYAGGWLYAGDAFITKINPAGSALVYSTYLGGSGDDRSDGIAVDSTGAAYVTGDTRSTDFPLATPIQGIYGGIQDAFITKVNPSGSALVYSTYLGGSNLETGNGITLDASGNAYVTGLVWSTDFPLMNPIQGINGGLTDAFVTKINPAGSAFVYSTYLGGSDKDQGYGVAVDVSGNAYVTGDTWSTDFPLVAPIQAIFGGGWNDVFITKVNPAGSALVYSTYLGGSDLDFGFGVAVDASGNAYVTGDTSSTNFPLLNPIQGINGGWDDAFITKVNPSGSALVYSTYLGGSDNDQGQGIAVDASGSAYVTGYTWSTDFPLASPIQVSYAGGGDSFVTKLNPLGSTFVYSTYLGGSGTESSSDIAVDASGNAYVTGDTSSWDFPLVAPLQRFIGGGVNDAFITKISGTPPPVVQLTITPDAVSIARGGTLGYSVTATNTTVDVQCFNYWEDVTLPNGSTYPPTGALFGPLNVCLNGNGVKNVHLTHGVPMAAPVGAYIFNAYVGAYPIAVVDEAHFNFDVTAFNPATQNPQDSWRLLENGFRQ